MPPLLAALLMMELGCDWSIVEAIDLSMEWRHWQQTLSANCWYEGVLGHPMAKEVFFVGAGTFWWPSPRLAQSCGLQRYYE